MDQNVLHHIICKAQRIMEVTMANGYIAGVTVAVQIVTTGVTEKEKDRREKRCVP